MCDNVIIHKPDGTEIVCEDQKDLMAEMPEGLFLEPPMTPAEQWNYYIGDGIRWAWIYEKEAKKDCRLPDGYSKTFALPYPFAFIPVFQVPLDFHDPIGDLDDGYWPDHCLCPVDLEKTAKMNGYRCSKNDPQGEWDAFSTHFYQGADA